MNVYIEQCQKYDNDLIDNKLSCWENIFLANIKPGDVVVIKPNWISESHKYIPGEWEQVITHPLIVGAVLKAVLKILNGKGRVIITDGPQTSSSWQKIMEIMNPSLWIKMGKEAGIQVSVMDLRDDEWITKGDIIVERRGLPGDPLGSTICNLGPNSEFLEKKINKLGFFGADYNKKETNDAHANGNHFYKVSKSVLEADVFINLPKLKTHKKAGITCSLKNLVGINTYKNWLPHHTGGTPSGGGDQFPDKGLRSVAEGSVTKIFYDFLSKNPDVAKFFIPVKKIGKMIFGDTKTTVRSGSWFGNDTLWRTVLDLNKILFYANADGSLREGAPGNKKRYISIVDAVCSGEGNGPDAPDKKNTGILVMGTDPCSVDSVCVKLMGFDWEKIPTVKNSFTIKKYPISAICHDDIKIESSFEKFNKKINELNPYDIFEFKPSVGWIGNIEEDYEKH